MSCNPPLKLKTHTLPEAQKMAKALKSQALVVRIPTQGKKINFLRSAIRNTSLDPRTLRRYEKLLDDALESDREYLSMIDSIFNVSYSVTPVFFVPDSSFREFKAGSDKVFVDGTGSLISGQSIPESYLLLLTDDNKYKFRLFNQEGYRLPRIMPHKRDAFLPYMQILWQKEKYVADQVVYFQTRLSEISQLYPL
jgi:hypothetical protein